MKTEIHLFIFWEKARNKENELLDEVRNRFKILQTFCITWSPYDVGRNFTRFYGQNLPDNSQKELHCGGGEFKVVIVRDESPQYDIRDTSKGKKLVNTNTFDAKDRLREITGGGHKIHGTNNLNETKHNVAMLFGLSIDEVLIKFNKKENIKLKQNLKGTNGWNSFEELFHVLNQCSDYVVMRNHENINIDYFKKMGGDIDILSKDSIETKYILGDLKNISNEHLKVDVNNSIVLFEVYQIGENLLDSRWEDSIFETKQNFNYISCPNETNELYMLLYHSLFFKEHLQTKHIDRIRAKFPNIIETNENPEIAISESLKKFLNESEYKIAPPNDGYFNFRNDFKSFYVNNRYRSSKLTKLIKKIFTLSFRHKHISITFLSPMKRLLITELTIPYVCTIVIKIGK